MFRFRTLYLSLALGLIAAPVSSFATGPYCIAVSGGFGHGGSTFIAPGLSFPGKNGCNPWSGFTKTASTVVLQTSGDACLSSNGLVLTVSVSNADPDFIGGGKASWDYIRLTRSSTSASFSGGTDVGSLGGSAKSTSCTSSLLTLPSSHP
jgi:hypothetical protein